MVLTRHDRPPSVSSLSKSDTAKDINGTSGGELDAASKHRAEARYLNFYEAHQEPDADAQGSADFN